MKLSAFLIAILVLLPFFWMRSDAPAGTHLSPDYTDIQSESLAEDTLQMAYSEVIGSNDSTYHFRLTGADYTATNTAHNLSIDISDDTVTISMDDDYWQLSSEKPAVGFTLDGNRLTLHHAGYDEWYVNGPVGLQQGFTLYQPSDVMFNIGGTLQATATAQTLRIGDVLTFSGLMAYDAAGNTIPAAFELDDNKLVYLYHDTEVTYPITIDPWLQQSILTEPDAYSGNRFGWVVDIDQDTAVIGIPEDECAAGGDCGSAYVFVRSGITWTPEARLTASDAYIADNFGKAVALDGDTAYIGAPEKDCSEYVHNCGRTYVFVRNNGVWTQQAILISDDNEGTDFLGISVALQGDTAVAGAYGDNCLSTYDCGSVYVFVRNNGVWTQQAKLVANDGGREQHFGWDVAIDGDTIVVGAPYAYCYLQYDCGSAYVFTQAGTTWSFQAKLSPPDGRYEDSVGFSVAVNGDVAAIGAPEDDCQNGADCGFVYLYTRSGTTWTEQARLIPPGTAAGDRFGQSLALEGDYMVIGARLPNCLAGFKCGTAYVYRNIGGKWWQESILAAFLPNLGSLPQNAVAISGSTILAGNDQQSCSTGSSCGSTYVFIRDTPPPVPLSTSIDCVDGNLALSVSSGDGLFYVTASAGSSMPRDGIEIGTTIFNGPDKWDDVIVGETSGDLETIHLGQLKCRTDERPIPLWPPHRYHTTNPNSYFEWSSISNANNYRVFLFDDANAATRTVDIRQNSGGPTYLTLSTPLPDGRLFWRVRGRQNRIWSLWSIRVTLFKDPVAPIAINESAPVPTIGMNTPVPPNSLPTIAPPDNGPPPTFPAPPNSR